MAETFVATHAPDNGRASYNGLQADEWGAIGAAAIFLGLACYHGTMCAVRRSYLLWTLPLSGFLACLSLLEFAYSLERYLHTALLILGALCRWISAFLPLLALVLVFGRTTWHAARTNDRLAMKLATKIRGFLRWNTVFFNTLAILAYGIALIGSIVVAAFAATDQEQRRSPGSTNPAVTRGAKGIIKAALFLQLLIILAFVVIVGRFHQISSSWHLSDCDELRKRNWKALLMVIVIDCVVMLVAQLGKIVLYLSAVPPWTVYACDGVVLMTLLTSFAIVHPSRCLPADMTRLRLHRQMTMSEGFVEAPSNEMKKLRALTDSSEGSAGSV